MSMTDIDNMDGEYFFRLLNRTAEKKEEKRKQDIENFYNSI